MKLVIVESPAKAKTINNYLGKEYKVIASYGHVRDLPSKNGSVNPENKFHMTWEMDSKAKKQMQIIKSEAKQADEIILATDPDREGEAISWHVIQILQKSKLVQNKAVHRVVFNEINKKAILHAIQTPRSLDDNLIDAYLTRRALDYLVGFNISPILWRKLPGCRSAGRVQSVALRIICDRECEIESFITQEYWSISGLFSTATAHKQFQAKLFKFNNKKLEKFTITSQEQAQEITNEINNYSYQISDIEAKQLKRHPVAPFTTSTLQQEASRKLGFSVKKTMQIAQKLYEGLKINGETKGLITYMRTDSVSVSEDAINTTRQHIENNYTKRYLSPKPILYKSKSKNAQEAHEAIRPTDIALIPNAIKSCLDNDQLKLYDIIWKRMLTSQMASAILKQVIIQIESDNKQAAFKASGTTIDFDGFLKIYEEGKDSDSEDDNGILPSVLVNEKASLAKIEPNQHFTKPPARYTEASIVKKLEELGIGRPSTYASTISTLTDRNYVKIEKKQLIPEALGRIVTSFLMTYFTKYLEYDFTANLEEKLDNIADGNKDWIKTLDDFWNSFKSNVDSTTDLKITDVINLLNKSLEQFLFSQDETRKIDRLCQQCSDGELSLKLGKFGAFIGCSNYPDCNYTKQLNKKANSSKQSGQENNTEQTEKFAPKLLGTDSESKLDITLRQGPYGFYIQWDEAKPKQKPKRASIPKNIAPESVTLEQAMILGTLPKTLGQHPKTEQEILLGQGRFGPYIKYQNKFTSIPKDMNFLELTLQDAIHLIDQ